VHKVSYVSSRDKCTSVLVRPQEYERDAQSDHDGGRRPRDVIEHPRVNVLAHDLLVVRDDEHIDQDKWEQYSVAHLRQIEDGKEGHVRKRDEERC